MEIQFRHDVILQFFIFYSTHLQIDAAKLGIWLTVGKTKYLLTTDRARRLNLIKFDTKNN